MKEVVINNPYDVVALLSKYRKKRVEYFGVVGVDAGRNVMFQKNLFIGSSGKIERGSRYIGLGGKPGRFARVS